MSNIWTIAGANGEAESFHARNLARVQASRITQAPDRLTMQQTEAYDADPEFEYGEQVTVYRDDATWFKGICTAIARRGSGTNERINYTISGPWWQLEQIIYRQNYTRYEGGSQQTSELSKLVVGTDDAGERLNSGQVITAAVNYAINQLGSAALIQLGTIDAETEMPYEELNSLSCAEIVKRVLRWNPDNVAYWDYTTDPPTLHIRKRANLTARTYAIEDVTISENSINPRNDLQHDGVVVQYERTDTVDGNERKVIITDSAGDTSDPLKTLYLFFDLQGSSVSYTRQTVKVATIQKTSATWWAARHPKLKGATDISIADATQTAVDDEDEGGEDDGSSHNAELISGSIASWMPAQTNAQIIKAEVTYTPDGGSPRTENLRLQITGTSAQSKTYSTLGSSDPAEPTPDGLAAAILDSIDTLQYEGTLTLSEAEAGSQTHIDRTLNISGGRAEWETMAAQVYSVTYDIDAGRTTIQFGPAKHLGAGDLFQLLRNVRTRRGSSGAVRTSTTGADRDLPTRSPNTTTADDSGGSAATPPLQLVRAGDQLYVRKGTVNNEVPTIGGTPLDDDHEQNELSWSGDTTFYLVATIDESDGSVTAVAIENADPGEDTTERAKQTLGSVTMDGSDIEAHSSNLTGSQSVASCGSYHRWGKV